VGDPVNATADREGELMYVDARDVELLVTVAAGTHEVRVEHADGDYDKANRDMARLAADVIDQLGPGPVVKALRNLHGDPGVDERALVEGAVATPPPGAAVLACSSCKKVRDAADMRFAPSLVPRQRGNAARIPDVVCVECHSAR
jgi:hypothetical protein